MPSKRRSEGIKQSRDRIANLGPRILELLADGGEMTAGQIFDVLNFETPRLIAGVLCSLERSGNIERCGIVIQRGHNQREPRPVFCLPRPKATPVLAPRIVIPVLEYRSRFSEVMGEPPVGRSALDMRIAR